MKDPILSAAFTSVPPAPFDPASARLLIKRNDDNLVNEVDWALTKLAAKGYDGACLTIGNGVLRLLHNAHPDVFATHPGLNPPPFYVANTFTLAMELIQRSTQYKTRRYVDAIDDLVKRLEPESERSSLPTQWPGIREALLSFQD